MKSTNGQQSFKVSADWDKKSKLLRRRYPQLTQFDLKIENNDEKGVLEKIGKRLNIKPAEVIEIIKNTIPNKFINNLKIQYHE